MTQSEAAVERRIWIDGELGPWEEATVHVLSHSLQRGSLVFDYMSVHATPQGDAVFRLPEHVDRFVQSCGLIGLPLEADVDALARGVCETVRANPGARAVKLCAYVPSIEVDVVPVDDRVRVAIAAYDPKRDIQARKADAVPAPARVKLWVEKERRNRRDDIIPAQAKVAANYTSPMIAKWKARRAGYDEIVLVDEDGFLAEGPTTNLFVVDREGVLLTPPLTNVLPGITRRSILELAKHDGVPAREQPLRSEDLERAAEAFLTGTTAGVWPVESVDGCALDGESPGPVSRALGAHFRRVTAGEDGDFAHWLTPVAEGSS